MGKGNLEALAGAIRFEKEGRDYFLSSAKKVKNDTTRELFEQMAREEIKHIKVVNDIYERVKETGGWEEKKEDFASLKGKKNIFLEIAKSVSSQIETYTEDLQALEHAMKIEEKGKVYYENMVAETNIEFEKKFFSLLALEEEGHYLAFNDAREYILDPVGWYERRERSGLDGA